MNATITMDGAGRIVLPKPIRELLRLRGGAKLRADVVADKIELTPEPDDNVRMVRKGRRLVITGLPKGFDAVAAIKADREVRDEQVARRVRRRDLGPGFLRSSGSLGRSGTASYRKRRAAG